MEFVRETSRFSSFSGEGACAVASPSSAVVLGCFDGVHRGHAALLAAARKAARARSLPLTVWSMTGKPGEDAGLLCTEEARRALLLEAGADKVILAPFAGVRGLSCEEFVHNTLRGELGAVLVFCGENFRFGAGGTGSADTLCTLFSADGGETTVLPLLRQERLPGERLPREPLPGERLPAERLSEGRSGIFSPSGGTDAPPVGISEGISKRKEGCPPSDFPEDVPPISSTRIKALLRAGDPAGAAALLGRYFTVTGEVLHGRALGRTLGFPTANLRFPEVLVQPKRGVYFGHAILPSGERFAAVCNLGVRPTVEREGALLLECCLLSFDRSLYGEILRVEMREFLRPERAFSTKEALRAQVLADLAAGRHIALRDGVQ